MNDVLTRLTSPVVAVLVFTGTVAVAALLTGLFVMWLWNWLLPAIFGLKEITFWQGWGIACLSGTLFKTSIAGKQ